MAEPADLEADAADLDAEAAGIEVQAIAKRSEAAAKRSEASPGPVYMNHTPQLDPVELFEFLDGVATNQYPTNGYQLSERAKASGYSDNLVHFFESLPGSFDSEAEIMPYAEHPGGLLDESESGSDELTVEDIVDGNTQADV